MPRRLRRLYGRLPKFSPFLGTFQHAPSAGNRSRASFFENLLLTEEEHERRKRIKTNPYTGTFHFLPGRYSSLHGLQRFRDRHQQEAGGGLMTASFDELDRLAALGRAVSQKATEADNPMFAAVFMNGAFALNPVQFQQSQRRSLYPHKTKSGLAWYAELTMTNGLPRQRYGGAVDTSRKFGKRGSLDDCCLMGMRTTLVKPSLYRQILYKWNGFRVHFVRRMKGRAGGREGGWAAVRRRMSVGGFGGGDGVGGGMVRRASSTWRRDSSTTLAGLMAGGREGGHTHHHGQQQQQQQQQGLQAHGRQQSSLGMSMSHSSSGYIMGRTQSTGHMQLPSLVLEEGGAGGAPGSALGGGGGGYRSLHSKVGGTEDYSMGHEYYHPLSPSGNNPALPPSPLQQQQHQLQQLSKRSMSMAMVAGQLTRGGGGKGGEGRPPKPPGGVARKGGREGEEEGGEGRRKVGDDYDVDQKVILGEGSYAAVYGAVHRESGKKVAVKAIKRRYLFSEDEKASVGNEIDNMRRIPKHRNVIRMMETFETVEHVYLVLERSTHGNLEQMLQLRRKLTELETMWVVKQLLDAVDLLHRAGVLHCDLKPQNLLFSDLDDGIALAMKGQQNEPQDRQPRRLWMYTSPLGMILKVRFGGHRGFSVSFFLIKSLSRPLSFLALCVNVTVSVHPLQPMGYACIHFLLFLPVSSVSFPPSPFPQVCDFGLSRKVPDVRFFKHTGDIYRVPFSRICGTGGFIPPEIIKKQAFGKPADLWSIGVICYRMLSGSLPFIPPTKCLEQPVGFKGKVWDGISKDAQDFIARLLAPDQNKRATAREALGHKWLQTVPEWGFTPGLPSSPSPSLSSSTKSNPASTTERQGEGGGGKEGGGGGVSPPTVGEAGGQRGGEKSTAAAVAGTAKAAKEAAVMAEFSESRR